MASNMRRDWEERHSAAPHRKRFLTHPTIALGAPGTAVENGQERGVLRARGGDQTREGWSDRAQDGLREREV